jgi:broad specificity phosphatase PhoE
MIRHTQTEDNKNRINQGHSDSPLTKIGKKQAQELGRALRTIADKGTGISRVYSSDLGRCRQTAQIVNAYLGLEIVYTDRLREKNFGMMNGKPITDIVSRYDLDDPDLIIPQGESTNQMKDRIQKYILSLDDQKALLVSHDGCVRALIGSAGQKIEPTFRFIGKIEIGNGCFDIEVLQN